MDRLSFSSEPVLYIAVVDAVLMLAVSFGLPLTPEQKAAIDALLGALAAIVIRSQVTPVAKAKQSPP